MQEPGTNIFGGFGSLRTRQQPFELLCTAAGAYNLLVAETGKSHAPVPAAISRASSFEKTTPNDSAVATMQRLRALDAATQVFWHLSSNYCIIYYMTFKSNYSNFCLLRALAMSFCCVFHDQCAVESTIAASAGVLELEATAPCNAVETMVIHK